jgi:GNAT superfamily N-acetyltransferase
MPVNPIVHHVHPVAQSPRDELNSTPVHVPGLPGRLVLIDPGHVRDYRALHRFHYRGPAPATFARIVSVRHHPPDRDEHPAPVDPTTTAAVAVLSYPVPVSRGRERALGLRGWSYGRRIRFANAQVRTISRVIVHPAFRSLGLSTLLIRRLIATCPTRYVEAMARMGRAHPLFDRAGMTRFEPRDHDEPVYYLFDRHWPACVAQQTAPPESQLRHPEQGEGPFRTDPDESPGGA